MGLDGTGSHKTTGLGEIKQFSSKGERLPNMEGGAHSASKKSLGTLGKSSKTSAFSGTIQNILITNFRAALHANQVPNFHIRNSVNL